jgi:hypothetical protein
MDIGDAVIAIGKEILYVVNTNGWADWRAIHQILYI